MSPTSHFANRAPPKFIRGKLYKYHFETDNPANWWRREYQVRFSQYQPHPQSRHYRESIYQHWQQITTSC